MSTESYAHKAAKEVVAGWFREAERQVGPGADATCLGFRWQVGRVSGVITEYPFMADGTGLERWGEIPSYADLVARGTPPLYIADVVVANGYYASGVVEINHKHPLTEAKKAWYCGQFSAGQVLELPARWVLGQIGLPKIVPEEFYIRADPNEPEVPALLAVDRASAEDREWFRRNGHRTWRIRPYIDRELGPISPVLFRDEGEKLWTITRKWHTHFRTRQVVCLAHEPAKDDRSIMRYSAKAYSNISAHGEKFQIFVWATR